MKLEKLGRVRLSKHFQMRQFLYSEISVAFGIPNIPENPELAIQVGTQLCEQVLEPIVKELGPIIVRSGYRSAELNAFGNSNGLNCASNEKNYAYHIWDRLDAIGRIGASACIVIPSFNDGRAKQKTRLELKRYLIETLPCHYVRFFKYDNAFSINWREKPKHELSSWKPEKHWAQK